MHSWNKHAWKCETLHPGFLAPRVRALRCHRQGLERCRVAIPATFLSISQPGPCKRKTGLGEQQWIHASLTMWWLQVQLLLYIWFCYRGASSHTLTLIKWLLIWLTFFIPIGKDHQKTFAFSWQGQQHTFTVLPRDYVYSPALCYNLICRQLTAFSFTGYHTVPLIWQCADWA